MKSLEKNMTIPIDSPCLENKYPMLYTLPLLYDYAFPTFLIPNAMRTEFVLVNYLHSLHSNRSTHNELFLENQPNSLLEIIFDKSIGTWPTCWNSGTQLESGAYCRFLKIEKHSLYLGKQKYQKYIYPVSVSPYLNEFVGNDRPGSKLNNDYFWKYMSNAALTDVRNKDAVILLDFAQENEFSREAYEKLHEALVLGDIPPGQVVLIFNSFNAKELYEKWFPEIERKLEVIDLPYLISNSSYHCDRNPTAKQMTVSDFLSSENTIRKNYFLFKIRRIRDHRLALLAKMYDDCLLSKGDWSCLERYHRNANHVTHVSNKYGFDVDSEKVNELITCIPKSLEFETGRNFETAGGWEDNADNYKNSYFYVATETFMDTPYRSLTEKIFKPMINFQPFLFASWPGALKLLRELGFKTFTPYIDESYDDEPNSAIRLQKIYTEIKRLCNMSREEIHAWYWSTKEILLHNHILFRKYHRTDKYAEELASHLQKKIS